MAFIATALAVASVGFSAYGAAQASKGRKRQAASQKQQSLFNAEVAAENSADVAKRGITAIRDQRMMTLRNLSEVRTAGAASGVVVDQEGTSLQDSVIAMARAGAIDVVRLRENIDREMRRAEVQGAQFTAQADQFEIARSSENPFRAAAVAGTNAAVGNSDILFG